jgi:hypothetical protein
MVSTKFITIIAVISFAIIFSGAVAAADGNSSVATSVAVNPTDPPSETVKLIFIHHSSGGNWLADGNGNLGPELNNNNYYLSESDYGWDAEPDDNLGDHTDTPDWPSWFNDDKMPYVYNSDYHSAYDNNIPNPGGQNEIIMFKSCFPLSEVGDSIDDEKTIYNSLKPYFAAHPDKFFVLITPPGETNVESYLKTRELCNWLVDNQTGWLAGYTQKNVFVFDFYGVLSETNSHHRWVTDHVEHVYASNYDGISPYHNGDDHPNAAGNQKATAEFVPLLNYYYHLWKNDTTTNTTTPVLNINPNGGSFYAPVSLIITSNIPAKIYYTIDGSTPTEYSSEYTEPINITTSKTLKYFGINQTEGSSPVYTAKYLIYALVNYSYTVKVKYKLSNKKYRFKTKVKVKVKYKSHGKWKYKWVYKWKYYSDYKYGYRNEIRWATKWVLT